MNEVVRQLYGRKAARGFTDQPIEGSIVQASLRAAVMAPSAGNTLNSLKVEPRP